MNEDKRKVKILFSKKKKIEEEIPIITEGSEENEPIEERYLKIKAELEKDSIDLFREKLNQHQFEESYGTYSKYLASKVLN